MFGKGCHEYTESMCQIPMDDDDFTAMEMCCACNGGYVTCKDMDFVSTDANGKKCDDYTYDMCDNTADDADFTALTMCCVCGGGTATTRATTRLRTATPTGTTTLTVSRLPEDPDGGAPTIGGVVSVWWLLLLIIPLALCLCLPLFCFGRRKQEVDEESPHRISDGFTIGSSTTSKAGMVSASGSSTTFDTSVNTTRMNTAMSKPAAIIVRDEVEEATVYGTACDLFARPHLSNAKIASIEDTCSFGCGSGLKPVAIAGHGPTSLDGPWLVNGNPDIVAFVTGTSVVIDGDRGRQEVKLVIVEGDTLALEVNGVAIQGKFVGSRLIWSNGQTWRRPHSHGGSPSGLVVPMPVLGNRSHEAGGAWQASASSTGGAGGFSGRGGGSMQGGGSWAQGNSFAGGQQRLNGGVAQGGYSATSMSRSYHAQHSGAGYSAAFDRGGLDSGHIMLQEGGCGVPNEMQLRVGHGAPRTLHMGR